MAGRFVLFDGPLRLRLPMPCSAFLPLTSVRPAVCWGARAVALLIGVWACTSGHAQVNRCTDAQGRITYTNAPCAAGEAAVQVQPALTEQERAQQQAQYEQALQRREAERAARAEQEAAAQTQRAHEDSLRAATQAAQEAAERARQAQAAADEAAASANAPTVLPMPAWGSHRPAPVPPMYPPVHRPHPQPPHGGPGASAGTGSGWSCNVFRCTDGQGNTRPVP